VRLVFAGCLCAIVTADAIAEYVHMIEVRRYPADGRVTVFAGITTGNVGLVFSGRTESVMAAHAVADNAAMIKHGGQPGRCCMAVIALVAGRYVIQGLSG